MGCCYSRNTFGAKYDLGKNIGSGHFADVFVCTKKSNKCQYAVKIINKKHLVNTALLEDEVEILKRVGEHENILTLEETFDSKEEFYLVTEYCAGGDLFSRIVEMGSSSEKDCSNIMKQLVSAIHHIHDCGVTHRDLKPENILLTSNNKEAIIKVADFGLSKIKHEGDKVMRTVCGTWAYCAPEVIKRESYNYLVDNWTLGILMFVILAGYHPFDMYGDAPEAMLMKKIEAVQYDFDDDAWDDVSSHAKKIIQNLLQKDPSKRMSTQEFLKTDWANGRCKMNTKANERALQNLSKLVELRKKIKVTFLTTKMVGKFKAKLKTHKSSLPQPAKKSAWNGVVPAKS